MPHELEELTEKAMRLSSRERAVLAESLLLTIDEGEEPLLDAETAAELDRRARDLKDGRVTGIPADQVLRDVREALRQAR